MRNINRIGNVLETISKIWNKNPDLRLGQLLLNAVDSEYLYYIEEDELIKILEEVYK